MSIEVNITIHDELCMICYHIRSTSRRTYVNLLFELQNFDFFSGI